MALRLISLFTGFFMVITIVAVTPSRAQDADAAAKVLTGAVALFIIGSIIANELDRPNDLHDQNPLSSSSGDQAALRSIQQAQMAVNRTTSTNRGRFGEHRHKVLPTECSFFLARGYREAEVYGADCLENNVTKAKWLPSVCERQVRIRHGKRARVYDAECLHDHGWRDDRVARWR